MKVCRQFAQVIDGDYGRGESFSAATLSRYSSSVKFTGSFRFAHGELAS